MENEIKTRNQNSISDDLKELVITRLDSSFSSDKKISIGASGEKFTKEDLINHVRQGDNIGKKVVDMEMRFLKALSGGELLREINAVL
jgi:hypothetical protein